MTPDNHCQVLYQLSTDLNLVIIGVNLTCSVVRGSWYPMVVVVDLMVKSVSIWKKSFVKFIPIVKNDFSGTRVGH